MSQPETTACRVHSREVEAHQELLRQIRDALTLPRPAATVADRENYQATLDNRLAAIEASLASALAEGDATALRTAATIIESVTDRNPATSYQYWVEDA